MRKGAQDVQIMPGTLAEFLFRHSSVRERFRHRYEVEPDFISRLEAAGLIFSGRHPTRPIMQVLELPRAVAASSGAGVRTAAGVAIAGEHRAGITHPFFIGAQFHPELTSRPLRPQPMFMGLLAAAIRRKFHGAIDPRDPWAADIARWTAPLGVAHRASKPASATV
jgi:CTP synthase